MSTRVKVEYVCMVDPRKDSLKNAYAGANGGC